MLKLAIAWLLAPIMYLIIGLVFIIRPPKKNPYVGYRTKRAMKSEEHFKYAQNLSGLWLCILGVLLTIGVSVLLFFVKIESISVYLVVGVLLGEFIPLFILFPIVELKLKHFKVSFRDKIDPKDIIE